MSSYLQNQSTSERLLQTEEGSLVSEEEKTFYENKNNKYSDGYNVQNDRGEDQVDHAVTIAPKNTYDGPCVFW